MNAITNLNEIAEAVRSEHAQMELSMRDSLERAIHIGELLTQAKSLVSHGQWGVWLEENCQFSERSAQNFMRVYRKYPELTKAQHVADLTYREAIGLLAEPKDDLVEHEKVIEEGLSAWIDVAKALKTIRDGELYRAEAKTFEEFCRKNWALSPQRIRELLSSLDVVENIQQAMGA